MKCMFAFGRDPELSLLELESWLKNRKIRHKFLETSKSLAIVSLPRMDFKRVISQLGGTTKIAEILENKDYYSGEKSKIKYAISDHGHRDIVGLKKKVKSSLKALGLKAMLKTPRKSNILDPSESLRVAKSGFELLAYKDYVGKVIAISNPRSYGERDEAKPRKRREQAISIRLAKILINIAAKPNDNVLDPFCGYGVILQEAMLLGHNAIGVDNNAQCIKASQKNLEWMKKKFRLDSEFKLIHGDSRKLSSLVKKAGCMATEPHLGPVLKGLPGKQFALKVTKDLARLYSGVLKEAAKVVKGKIVIIVPRFRLHTNERIGIDFQKLLNEAGLRPVSKDIPIIYTAPKSRMEREIWVISG